MISRYIKQVILVFVFSSSSYASELEYFGVSSLDMRYLNEQNKLVDNEIKSALKNKSGFGQAQATLGELDPCDPLFGYFSFYIDVYNSDEHIDTVKSRLLNSSSKNLASTSIVLGLLLEKDGKYEDAQKYYLDNKSDDYAKYFSVRNYLNNIIDTSQRSEEKYFLALLSELVEKGFEPGQILFSSLLLKEEKYTDANVLMKKLIRNNVAWAQYNYGVNLYHGRGVGKDNGNALELLKSAEKNGFSQANNVIAQICKEVKDINCALKYYEASYAMGDPGAAFEFGMLLIKNTKSKKDVEKIVKALTYSGESGIQEAYLNLAKYEIVLGDIFKNKSYYEQAIKTASKVKEHQVKVHELIEKAEAKLK